MVTVTMKYPYLVLGLAVLGVGLIRVKNSGPDKWQWKLPGFDRANSLAIFEPKFKRTKA